MAYALSAINLDWAAGLVSAGAVAGITSVLLVMLMSQPRIFFSMSRDGLLPWGMSKVHPRFQAPYITTIITCVIVAITAGLVPIQVVGEMTSIGTLFAFVVVSMAGSTAAHTARWPIHGKQRHAQAVRTWATRVARLDYAGGKTASRLSVAR